LGASYEGYEEEAINLLKAIDARRPQQYCDTDHTVRMAKSKGRGSRELRSLVSTVNYDTGSARKRVEPRERVLSLVQ
jgi:hypothetical protein